MQVKKYNSNYELILALVLHILVNCSIISIIIGIRGSLVFGYLQIQKSELLVREYEAYKSVYCGLCKQIGKDYSFLTRLSLSYDCTFYAMLLMSLSRSCNGFYDGRCRFNPLKKCKYAGCQDESYSKAAAFSVISVYYKLQDDLRDSGFLKRFAVRMIKPFFGHWRKKAQKYYPLLDEYVSQMMELQAQAEQEENASLDFAAHPTAQMMSNVLALEANDELQKRVLREFGYHLGRWIYLIDAADDYEDDIKYNNFNPFMGIKTENIREYMNEVLNQSLARAYDAYNLIEIKDFKGILDNMMLYGFPSKQNLVVFGQQEVNNDKSV